jgi:hypothetical protein
MFTYGSSALAQTPASIKEVAKRIENMPAIADCKALGVCDLKKVTMVERKIKVLLADQRAEFANYMTDFRFVIEVDKAEHISNYGVIQFMRGCMFESNLEPNGTVNRDFTYVHKNFGEYKLVKHADWTIDSSHADPLSTSFENYGRFDLFKWNADPTNLDADNATWYFDAEPPHGTVFKADLIGTTGLIESASIPSARNSSLEFETCIFKIDDVPLASDVSGTGVDRSKAIWCAKWDHKYSYDFTSGKVVADKVIHPFCASN